MERFRVLPMMVVVGISLSGCADQSSPEPRDVAATPEATRCQAHEECEGRVAYLRDPVPNDSRPGRGRSPSSERTARKVRPPLSAFWWPPRVVEVGAVLLSLPYFYPPVMPDPAHGGRSSRCRSRRRVRAARLLNRASTSGRAPACLPSSTCPPRAATGYRPPKRSRPERGRGRKTRHPAQPWVPPSPTVRTE
jgi:hypothetical protein